MSTLLIIFLIALAVGLLIFAVFKKLFKLAIVAVMIALMFAGAFTVFSDDEEQLVGGCAGVAADQTQTCCDNWATESNMVHTECLGNWTIANNSCSWNCSIVEL